MPTEQRASNIAVSEEGSSPSEAASLDKLREAGQKPGGEGQSPQQESHERMCKREAAKLQTLSVVRDLEKLDSDVPYDRVYDCCKRIDQEDGYLTSRYCNSRWCVVCSRIRTGTHVNNQVPVVRTWEDPHLVTLTVPNIPYDWSIDRKKMAGALRENYEEMVYQFSLCRKAINRTRGLKLRAFRSFEAVYNEERDELNTHFHAVVPNREIAEAIVEEWLKRWPDATRSAQDLRKMGGAEEDLLEVCKYVTKIVGGEEGEPAYPPEVLDAIFRGLHRKHISRSVGYNPEDFGGSSDEEVEEMEEIEKCLVAFVRPNDFICWHWEPEMETWVDRETGQCLTGDPNAWPAVPP